MLTAFKNLFTQGKNESLEKIINDNAFLVDVRTPQEFAAGSVRGAINIPLDQVQSQLEKFKNKKHIIVFCRSGNRSNQALSILQQNGFNNVTNGGTWQNVKQYTNNKIK
jgi:rhodanese-related sulfurtransferase